MSQTYLYLSAVIGLILIVDAVLLKRVNGQCGGHPLLTYTTTIEFLWAVVSGIALYKAIFVGWSILIPSLYLAHNVFGWVYGLLIISRDKQAVGLGKIYVPMWYVYFGGTVGLAFTVLSILALFQ